MLDQRTTRQTGILPVLRPATCLLLGMLLGSLALVVAAEDAQPVDSEAEESKDGAADAPLLPAVEVEIPPQAERVKSVTILGRERLDEQPGGNMNDFLLTGNPGISTARRSNLGFSGPNAGFYLRGLNGPRVAVFVDGIPVQVNNSFHVRSDQFSPDLIDRLEITRGPSVVEHGASAVGGVIDIFTRKPGPGLSGHLNAVAGDLGTAIASGDLGYGWDGGHLLLSATDRDTDGQALGEAHDERNVNFKLSQTLGTDWTFGLRVSNTREFASNATSADPDEVIFKFTQDLDTVVLSLDRKTERSNTLIAVHRNSLDTGSFRESGNQGIFRRSERVQDEDGILVKHTWRRDSGNTVTVGVNAVEFSTEQPKGSAEISEDFISPYVHFSRALGSRTKLEGGLRVTDGQFGTDASPEIGLVRTIDPTLAVRVRAGKAFRVPRVDDVELNANVDPEDFYHAEFGVNKRFGDRVELDVAAWWMEGDNLISAGLNTGEFSHTGVESILSIRVNSSLDVFFGVALMDLEETANVPQQTLDAGVRFHRQRWNASLSARIAADNARTTLDDYFVADARVSYGLGHGFELIGDIYNLTDERFATFQGRFGGPVEQIGRTVLGGVRYAWGQR